MRPHPPLAASRKQEFYDWRLWTARGVLLAFAVLAVAILGVVSHGATYGSGDAHAKGLLEGRAQASFLYVLLTQIHDQRHLAPASASPLNDERII